MPYPANIERVPWNRTYRDFCAGGRVLHSRIIKKKMKEFKDKINLKKKRILIFPACVCSTQSEPGMYVPVLP
jgi:predicted SpoU family rRNA methylase